MSDHNKYSPSVLPKLRACPRYQTMLVSGEDANRGTMLHKVMATNQADLSALTPGDRAIIERTQKDENAFLHDANEAMREAPLAMFDDGDFPTIITEGTADLICYGSGHVIVTDYKFGYKLDGGCELQCTAYGVMALQKWPQAETCTVRIVYASLGNVLEFVVRRSEIPSLVAGIKGIIAGCEDPAAVPEANAYCDWCERQQTCPAVLGMVKAVVERYPADPALPDPLKLASLHASQIPAAQAADLYDLAAFMGKWSEGVKHNLKGRSDSGEELPGLARTKDSEWPTVTARQVQAAIERMVPADMDYSVIDELLGSVSLKAVAEAISRANGQTVADNMLSIGEAFAGQTGTAKKAGFLRRQRAKKG